MDKPHALRLADELETEWITPLEFQSAAELRRLHEVNQELVEALKFCAGSSYITDVHEVAEATLAKSKGEE